MLNNDYYDAIINTDISRVDKIKRDSERANRLMKSYSRNQGFLYSMFIKFFWMLKNESKRVMFSVLRGHK